MTMFNAHPLDQCNGYSLPCDAPQIKFRDKETSTDVNK